MSQLSRRAALTLGGIFLVSLLAAKPSSACLNDRDTDTLVEEARALPGIVEIITGRFERNPPLYYQMRIARVEKELVITPDDYNLYDDIAVAYDRIGKSDKALEWMAKKRHVLSSTTPKDPAVREAWYRYYANTGTARVHRWIRSGADREHLQEVKQARQEITHALEIKPDAHFGRETYQLQVMEWIIDQGKDDTTKNGSPGEEQELAYCLEVRDGLRRVADDTRYTRMNEVAQGLAGLIALGNAWESVDVFMALGRWLERSEHGAPAFLAQLRAEELADRGAKSLLAPYMDLPLRIQATVRSSTVAKKRLARKYKELRAEAEQWHTARTAYMMTRLQAGRHPDTDPSFWAEWHPTPAASLSTGYWQEQWDKINTPQLGFNLIAGVFWLAVGGVIVQSCRRLIQKRHTRKNMA